MRYATINFILLFIVGLIFSSCSKVEDDTGFIAPPIELTESEMLLTSVRAVLNPNGVTPLAAEVTFESFDSSTVEVQINGSIPVSFKIDTPSKIHKFPLIGLYPDATNQISIKITNDKGQFFRDTLNVLTPPLPDHMPDIEILTANPEAMEPGMSLSELNIGGGSKLKTQPIIFDHEGVIRWFINLEFTDGWTAPFKKLQNGNLVFARAHTIYEYDWLGKEINRWHHWGYFQHHDLIELPNGNFIIPVSQEGLGSALDQIIELDRQTGEIVRQWDLREVLDVDRFDLIWQSYDWVHVNSVWYDERDESLLISGRNQALFKISKENELLWILGAHKGWGAAGINGDAHLTSDYLLTAIDETGNPYHASIQEGANDSPDFAWAWGQHAAQLLPNGNVYLFDNGWKRNFVQAGQNGFSRGVEYHIDETAMSVEQVWQYGQERGTETFSDNISNVLDLPQTGNRLFCPGNIRQPELTGAKIVEVSYPQGDVVFEANIRFKNSQSTGDGWGHADLVYRSIRLTLY